MEKDEGTASGKEQFHEENRDFKVEVAKLRELLTNHVLCQTEVCGHFKHSGSKPFATTSCILIVYNLTLGHSKLVASKPNGGQRPTKYQFRSSWHFSRFQC